MAEIQFISKSQMVPYGTTQLRCIQPADYLKRTGTSCRLGCIYRNMPSASKAMVFHRAISDAQTWSYVEYAKARGLVLIYDIDDYLFDDIADSSAPRYRKIIKEFDVVFASTRFLADRISTFHSDVRIVQSGLSDSFVANVEKHMDKKVRDASDAITIGYFSGSAHHDEDFKLVKDALLSILRENNNVRLLLIGKLKYSPEFSEFEDQFEYRQFMPYDEFLKVFQEVDVNLAPNRISHPKAQGRSEIKYVEAAAWGVPTVASPTETYKSVIRHQDNGILAEDGNWMDPLVDLVNDHASRIELGNKARADIVKNYYPDAKSTEWKTLIDDVLVTYGDAARSRRKAFKTPFLYLNSCAHWAKRFLKRKKREITNAESNLQQNES